MNKTLLITEKKKTNDCQSSNTGLLSLDLPALVARMKQNSHWIAGELCAKIIIKKEHKRIILTAIHKGTVIESFQSNDSITFRIIEGSLMYVTENESINLIAGEKLILHENINYKLTATEDSVFLLTIVSGIVRHQDN